MSTCDSMCGRIREIKYFWGVNEFEEKKRKRKRKCMKTFFEKKVFKLSQKLQLWADCLA
jgi:hypothetical protein